MMMHAADTTRHGWPYPTPGLRVLSVRPDGGEPPPTEAVVNVDVDRALVELYEREYTDIA